MNAPHGDASARPVGNYLHGCNSSELISPRSPCRLSPYAGNGGRYEKRLERWTHVRICPCGHATPITTDALARMALARHRCERHQRHVQLELRYDLPDAVRPAVVHYLSQRRQRRPVDIDGTLVRRFADGEHHLPLNPHERFAVYALLRARGTSRNACTQLLRLSWSTQARYRRLLEAAA